jgi:hypothetical protein
MAEVHAVAPTRAESVGAVLARAFQEDPVMSWLFPDAPDRRLRLLRFFVNSVERVNRGHRLIFGVNDLHSAALWDPPGTWRLTLWDQIRLAPAMLSTFGFRIFLVLKMLAQLERHHLAEPHYYLFAIGTEPELQCQHLGTTLMTPMLERCDREGLPAYLESSNPRNEPFYRRLGFAVTGEVQLPANEAPSIKLMRREPR